ncbi:MAG: hypothetical protein MJ181_12060 [Treponema sp.]|nr:hypothetical protein [Treponema sp.]
MEIRKADASQIDQIFSLYKDVVQGVAKTSVKLGWNMCFRGKLWNKSFKS